MNVTLVSGALVWIFAREAYHVGASGLVFGYFGGIVARAMRWSRKIGQVSKVYSTG